MEFWSRAVLIAFWSAILVAVVIGYWAAGVGGALLGIAFVWIATICLTAFWPAILLMALIAGTILFWNVGL